MVYEGTVYRPPSEADSLLVQATIGCAWNRCTFCDMYTGKKFRIRSLEEIKRDLKEALPYKAYYRRLFLCDGDALVIPTAELLEIMREARRLFPELEGIRSYASAKDILRKSPAELQELAAAGLDMVYIGLESGSDRVLESVNKGITKQQMIDAAGRLKQIGIKQSISMIAGLGGEALQREHILESADALNQMQPEFLGLLVLYVGNDAALFQTIREGSFRLPSSKQVLAEMQLLLQNLELENCFFSSAHVSNYVNIRGRLPADKEKMLQQIAQVSGSL